MRRTQEVVEAEQVGGGDAYLDVPAAGAWHCRRLDGEWQQWVAGVADVVVGVIEDWWESPQLGCRPRPTEAQPTRRCSIPGLSRTTAAPITWTAR